MAIRMIATDLDGTLLTKDHSVTERTRAALAAAMDAGALVVLSTGRMLASTMRYVNALNVNAPFICFNGALTYDHMLKRPVQEKRLSRDVARAVCLAAEREGLYVQAFWGDRFYYGERRPQTDYYEQIHHLEGVQADGPLSESIPCGVYKLLFIVKSGDGPKCLSMLRSQFAGVVDAAQSSDVLVECVAEGVSKGASLFKLGASLEIAPSEIMAFGDQSNDLSMITSVGHGYAMANADESIRRQARFVAPPNSEDGVAQVIERCIKDGAIEPPRGRART